MENMLTFTRLFFKYTTMYSQMHIQYTYAYILTSDHLLMIIIIITFTGCSCA